MLRIEHAYWLLALFLTAAAVLNLRERRAWAAAFWAVLAALFAGGDAVLAAAHAGDERPAQLAGLGVIALALLAPRMRRGHLPERDAAARSASAARLGHRLFGPALLIPLITAAVALAGERIAFGGTRLFATAQMTLTGLALSCAIALLAALAATRAPPRAALGEGRRLLDTMGWAALLPLVLAALGGVFAATGVGDAIAALTSAAIPVDSRLACVLAYGLGMVLFTVIMGNAFAAFPVLTAGIGLPLLILRHGADPAVLGALGMLTGYCGTLLTPMAANFNIVPAALLELDDQNGVIRMQVPTALALLAVNLVLMYVLVFR
ncbi:MAG: DUF979 family protein [Mizugakiibacter sp.]|uniref:5-oxoproline transporter, DUF979 family subunit n=1 Tax=Mizugakiibacter sp. TaxID=1972610 RepID=UPI0031C2219D|nr:DUF979 domain-containing protein [Xanthomonadaceae bacterium]